MVRIGRGTGNGGSWVVVKPHHPAPNDPWVKCPSCGKIIEAALYKRGHRVCPSCGDHGRLTADERIDLLADPGTFTERIEDIPARDPLSFPGYPEKVKAMQARCGMDEAVKTGTCSIDGVPVAIAAMDSHFMMASMGGAVGEKIARLVEHATENRLPLIISCCSGGARMQEGLVSLMQMAKVSAALAHHRQGGLLYISLITDPTTGGVTASFAMLGDIIIAEPGALLGFAGRRVIENTVKKALPDDFQTAEFALEHGLIDMIVDRRELARTIGDLLRIHSDKVVAAYPPAPVIVSSGEQWRAPGSPSRSSSARRRADRVALLASVREREAARDMGAAGSGCAVSTDGPLDLTAWQHVKLARDTRRPTSVSYIDKMIDGFMELHGDRSFADDPAIITGLGYLSGIPVTVIAQEKGRTTGERLKRNFGCANPEGYRKSLRIAREAERFNRPIITIVDTQGAYCGVGAEERGQGGAIADNLLEFSQLKVPVIAVLIGEGGSGGALALAVADHVAMLEYAVYSVLSPEGFASILWKDGSRAMEAASVMKMTARDALALGVVDEVIPEPAGGAQADPSQAAAAVRASLVSALARALEEDPSTLLEKRYERYRRF